MSVIHLRVDCVVRNVDDLHVAILRHGEEVRVERVPRGGGARARQRKRYVITLSRGAVQRTDSSVGFWVKTSSFFLSSAMLSSSNRRVPAMHT